MLSKYDEFPIHQTTEPVSQPATTDFNFYERFRFTGYNNDGSIAFSMTLGVYPNRRVMDAAFSIVVDGVQYSALASRLAPMSRNELVIGPFTLQVLDPMREIRLSLAPNETDIQCDLVFSARTAALEEPRSTVRRDGRILMETMRFTQFGHWQGWISVNGQQLDINHDTFKAVRDRSWGIRPVGEKDQGIGRSSMPEVFWLWVPLHFSNCCTHMEIMENPEGKQTHSYGHIIPAYSQLDEIPEDDQEESVAMTKVRHHLQWHPGTRMIQRASISLEEANHTPHHIELQPMNSIYMLGLGYGHPQWGHGMWQGDEAIHGEVWKLSEIDHNDLRFQHVLHICRTSIEDEEGSGLLEQLCLGRHKPSGFGDLLDLEQPQYPGQKGKLKLIK